jgi:hypothetical protein
MNTYEDQLADWIDRQQIIQQIGTGNILAISGGRIIGTENGIELPVSNGYSVRIELDPSDTYTVTRVFKRAGKEFVKGSRSDVYCDQLSEIAYRAGMFRSYDENEWPS